MRKLKDYYKTIRTSRIKLSWKEVKTVTTEARVRGGAPGKIRPYLKQLE